MAIEAVATTQRQDESPHHASCSKTLKKVSGITLVIGTSLLAVEWALFATKTITALSAWATLGATAVITLAALVALIALKIIEACRAPKTQLQSRAPEPPSVSSDKRVSSKKLSPLSRTLEEIKQLESIQEFEETFAAPQYQKMADFYTSLSNDPLKAKPLILKKTEEVKKEIQLVPDDADKGDKLEILEKQCLSNLRKMAQKADNTAIEEWNRELAANREVWTRTAKETAAHTLSQPVIDKLRRKIKPPQGMRSSIPSFKR